MGTVFATDTILATLMCSPRSMYSWDIVIQKVGNKLFLDKRDASFDLLTVSRTINTIVELGLENVFDLVPWDVHLKDVIIVPAFYCRESCKIFIKSRPDN